MDENTTTMATEAAAAETAAEATGQQATDTNPAPAEQDAGAGDFAAKVKKVFAGIFGEQDKVAEQEEGGADEAPAPEGTYTEEQLQAKLAEERASWEQELATAKADEEKAAAERAALEGKAKEALAACGMPEGLAGLVDCTSAETVQAGVEMLAKAIDTKAAAVFDERVKGKQPEGLGRSGADNENAAIAAQIRRGIRGE